MDDRLTEDYLIENGFTEATDLEKYEKTFFQKQIGRFEYLRIYLGDYPDTNPNCGSAMLYRSEVKGYGVSPKLDGKVNKTENDKKRINNFTVWAKPDLYSLGSHFISIERLKALYFGLTGKKDFFEKLDFEKN